MTRRGIREVVLLLTLFGAYTGARMLADTDLVAARRHADGILALERAVGLDLEAGFNHAVSGASWAAAGMSFWYAALHYLVTPLVLLWLYRRRPERYRVARNGLVIGSALGLVGYVLMPTAPPRLMSTGYLDVLASTADLGWWSSHASAPAGLGSFTNELAAMPSLHVGWAFWVAWSLRGVLPRLLGFLYAGITAVVVVGTANHWVLDAVAGVAVVAVGILIASRRQRRVPPAAGHQRVVRPRLGDAPVVHHGDLVGAADRG